MSKKFFTFFFNAVLTGYLITGFVLQDKNPITKFHSSQKIIIQEPIPYTSLTTTYTDNFDGANDTTALKARGYKVWYRGTGPQAFDTWFQGNSAVFTSFNGPSTGYVAANYLVVTGTNNIDSWLVFPRITGGIAAGDSLYFYSRSPDGDTFPDSIRVMYSVSDSVPEGSWTELGRYLNSVTGWQLKGFNAPTTSVNGRFAIRYNIVNGGPSGQNSDYIGIDAASIVHSLVGISGNTNIIPSKYLLNQNYPNPFNPTTRISFDLPKADNVKLAVYDILGNEVSVIVNGFKQAGSYNINFNAGGFASGVYFYKLQTSQFTDVKKMLLVK